MAGLPAAGWERFFEEVDSFLTSLRQQAGTASEEFSHYAIERLEVCIVNISRLLTLLRGPLPSGTRLGEEESTIILEYCAYLSQLLQCLHIISLEWQAYLEVCELRSQSAYAVGHVQSASRPVGRP